MPLACAVLLSFAACATAPPTIRPAGSPAVFQVVSPLPNSSATATITLTDSSGLVAGVTSVDLTTLGLSASDWQAINTSDGVVPIRGSNDIALTWNNGICQREPTVTVSGTAQRLVIAIQPGPAGSAGACVLVGSWITLRLETAGPIDIKGVSVYWTGM